MQLCLGTAQFGMDYGIKNQKKPELEKALTYFDYATQNGIYAIDTAAAYGDAEEIIGIFLKKKTISREMLFISTKLLPNILDPVKPEHYVSVIRDNLQKSLQILHLEYVDAYLLHSARYAHCPEILYALSEMKKEGLARKVGVSVYEPEEAIDCMAHPDMEFLQVPYSIFDHRMKTSGVLKKVTESNCNLAARSAFIQGLISMKIDEIPPFLKDSKPILRELDKFTQETGWNRIALAIGYVKHERSISHLVFGIDSMEQLKENIQVFQKELPDDIYQAMDKKFEGIKAEIVMPSLWKK